MPKSLEAITHDVLELPRYQQFTLVNYILSLDGGTADPDIAAARDEEIAARLQAYREGQLERVPYEQVKAEIESLPGPCK